MSLLSIEGSIDDNCDSVKATWCLLTSIKKSPSQENLSLGFRPPGCISTEGGLRLEISDLVARDF